MKASELIENLSELIEMYGDRDVYCVSPGDDWSFAEDVLVGRIGSKTIEYYEGYKRGDLRKDFLAFSIEPE